MTTATTKQNTKSIESISVSDARKRFGALLKMVDRKGSIAITCNGRPAVYVVSPKLFEAAFRGSAALSPTHLHRLQQDFDRMVAKMQRPEHAAVMNQLMTMDSSEFSEILQKPLNSAPPRRRAKRQRRCGA